MHHYNSPTFDQWIVNSMEILKGARNRLIALDGVSEPLIEEAIAELDDLRKNQYASAYFDWNRASAMKPNYRVHRVGQKAGLPVTQAYGKRKRVVKGT